MKYWESKMFNKLKADFLAALAKDTVASEALLTAKMLALKEADERREAALQIDNRKARIVSLVGIAVPIGTNQYDIAGTVLSSNDNLTGVVFIVTGEYKNGFLREAIRIPLITTSGKMFRVSSALLDVATLDATIRRAKKIGVYPHQYFSGVVAGTITNM